MNILELIVAGMVIIYVIFTMIVYGIDVFENRNKKREEPPQIQDKRCDNCGYEMYCADGNYPCHICKRNPTHIDFWVDKEVQ